MRETWNICHGTRETRVGISIFFEFRTYIRDSIPNAIPWNFVEIFNPFTMFKCQRLILCKMTLSYITLKKCKNIALETWFKWGSIDPNRPNFEYVTSKKTKILMIYFWFEMSVGKYCKCVFPAEMQIHNEDREKKNCNTPSSVIFILASMFLILLILFCSIRYITTMKTKQSPDARLHQ